MTSPTSEKRASPVRSKSEDLSLEVHVLECGHGDTILVHLPGNRWALIDCHLPQGRIREDFFDFVTRRDIARLDLLCLTHPHLDHFHGMLDVVDYFTRDGRSIGTYCDSGVDPVQVRDLLRSEKRPESEISEYNALHRRLDGLIGESMIRYYRVDENTEPISIAGYGDRVHLIPIAPDPSLVRKITRAAIAAGTVRGSVNLVSLVLLLRLKADDDVFDFLLAGDAHEDSLDRALRVYRTQLHSDGDARVDAVKVPHHGSGRSHSSSILEAYRTKGKSVAAISVGAKFRVLPDREAMREYIEGGWVVLLTTKRTKPWRRSFVVELAGRKSREGVEFERQDIHITWTPTRGLVWAPPEAQVGLSALALYDSASESREPVLDSTRT